MDKPGYGGIFSLPHGITGFIAEEMEFLKGGDNLLPNWVLGVGFCQFQIIRTHPDGEMRMKVGLLKKLMLLRG